MKLTRLLPALSMAACAALWAQSPEPSYSLDGAWFGQATIPGAPRPAPFMDIFATDSNNQGQSGSVLCTLQLGKIQSPMGLVSLTPTGHGNWVRVGKNKFAFTAWRVLMDADGRPVGTAKFWGTRTPHAYDASTGTMNFEYYDQDGKPFLSSPNALATVETRIGTSLAADPNPIPVTGNTFLGSTTIRWSAPEAQAIEIHVGAPDGPLLAAMGNRGSLQTGNWVPDGMMFYLQDVTGGKSLTSDNTLATLVVRLQKK